MAASTIGRRLPMPQGAMPPSSCLTTIWATFGLRAAPSRANLWRTAQSALALRANGS